jgi:WD40 repeat protein
LLATSFSPDGSRVVTIEFAASSSMTVRVIDLASGELLRTAHGNYSHGSAWLPGWSPEGRFFFYRADSALNVYDSVTNSIVPVPVAAESVVADDLQVAGVA